MCSVAPHDAAFPRERTCMSCGVPALGTSPLPTALLLHYGNLFLNMWITKFITNSVREWKYAPLSPLNRTKAKQKICMFFKLDSHLANFFWSFIAADSSFGLFMVWLCTLGVMVAYFLFLPGQTTGILCLTLLFFTYRCRSLWWQVMSGTHETTQGTLHDHFNFCLNFCSFSNGNFMIQCCVGILYTFEICFD